MDNSIVSSRHSLPSVLTRQLFDEYLRYRNQAIRLVTKLRKRYYDTKPHNLHHSDSHNCWRQMNRFTGQTRQLELTGSENNIWNGSVHHLTETMNLSLIAVSDDLHPNSDTNPSSDSTFEKCQGRVACRTESCQKIWKMAEVLPIPKFHPPMSIQSDLRSISQTPTISKQLEATVGNWIMGYVRG